MAYKLSLRTHLRIHNVFHISLLKKYIHDSTHVIDWNGVQVEPKREFQVEPLHILAIKETLLWNWVVAWVKVQRKHFSPKEATW